MNWLMFTSVLFLAVLVFLGTRRQILHPSVLACGVFALSTLVMALNGEHWKYEVDAITVIYIIIALSFFSFGVKIGERMGTKSAYRTKQSLDMHMHYHVGTFFLMVLSALSLAVTYLYFRHQYAASVALGNSMGIPGMILYLRQSAVFDADNEVLQLSTSLNMGLSFVKALNFVCLYIIIYKLVNKEKDWFKYIVPVICMIANVILTTGRGAFISLLTAIIFNLFIISRNLDNKQIQGKIVKYSIAMFGIFIVMFFLLGSLTGKDEVLNFNDTVSIYIGSSILCFDYLLTHGWDTPSFFGFATFRGVYGMIGRFIGGVPAQSNHSEMVRFSEYSSNVYTSFYPYVTDFGLIGSLIVIVFVGMIFGILWKLYLRSGRMSFITVIYGGLVGCALGMFSIAEKVLSNYIAMNVIAQLIFVKLLLDFVVKKKN